MDEQIKVLFELFIDCDEVPTKKLNELGFKAKDINQLIEDGIIERIRRGYYICNVEKLFYYGKSLVSTNYSRAVECFKRCFQINRYPAAAFQLFLKSIKDKNYDEAFFYLDYFYDVDNEYYASDCNYYLYLLNMICELPEGYKDKVNTFTLEDITIKDGDKRYSNRYQYNKVRLSTYNKKLILAQRQLGEITRTNGKLSVQDVVSKMLINQAIDVQRVEKNEIIDLINSEKYEELINKLNRIDERCGLGLSDTYVLKLAQIITKIRDTQEVPELYEDQHNSLFSSIDSGNFQDALILSDEYLKKRNISPDTNSINLLLRKIIELVNEINFKNAPKYTIQDVLDALNNNNLDFAYDLVDKYLESIGKSEYNFLVADLIKLSLLDDDLDFARVLGVLNKISDNSYVIDIKRYVQYFYDALGRLNFEEAKLYLDIINNCKNIGSSCSLCNVLNNIFIETNKFFNEDEKDFGEVVQKIETPIVKRAPREVKVIPSYPVKKNVAATPKKISFDASNYILEQINTLHEKGALILKPMGDKETELIHEAVSKINDIVSFDITYEGKKRVVLRYKPYIDEYVDVKSIISDAKDYYKEKKYKESLDEYKKLLEFGNPSPFIYASIGLTYIKLRDKAAAIDFLIIATELYKMTGRGYDYSDLVLRLRGLIDEEDKKPTVRMKLDDFFEDLDDAFGVSDAQSVRELIYTGMSYDEAFELFNINDEDKALLLLSFARDAYTYENFDLGDEYIKAVEKTKNKTAKVIRTLEDVRKSKKFYRYRNKNGSAYVLSKNN